MIVTRGRSQTTFAGLPSCAPGRPTTRRRSGASGNRKEKNMTPMIASLICVFVAGVLGALAGFHAGEWFGYSKGYDDSASDRRASEWDDARKYWGHNFPARPADVGQVE